MAPANQASKRTTTEQTTRAVIGTDEVAALLGISANRVRELDHVLQPIRVGGRGVRAYDPARVEQLAKERAKRRQK